MTASSWYTSGQLVGYKSLPDGLETALDWIENFVAKEHPQLGREGKICPFVPGALANSTLYFRSFPDAKGADDVNEAATMALEDFPNLPPNQHPEVQFKSLIMVFPAISAAAAPEAIDGVQRKRKLEFVEAGLMIGQFHERNLTPAAHNPQFYPLRSPVPMMAVRIMVPTDVPFLTQAEYSRAERAAYMKAYIRVMRTWPASGAKEKGFQSLVDVLYDLLGEIDELDQAGR